MFCGYTSGLADIVAVLQEKVAVLQENMAVLQTYRAVLRTYRAVLHAYRAVLRRYRDLDEKRFVCKNVCKNTCAMRLASQSMPSMEVHPKATAILNVKYPVLHPMSKHLGVCVYIYICTYVYIHMYTLLSNILC